MTSSTGYYPHSKQLKPGDGGVIAVDRNGNYIIGYNSDGKLNLVVIKRKFICVQKKLNISLITKHI